MRRIFFALAALVADASACCALDAVTTPLDVKACDVLAIETTEDDGTPLKKSDHYPTAWRCVGLAPLSVYIVYGDQREQLAFGDDKKEISNYIRHGHFGSWGPSIEWIGTKTANGVLEPVAAIVKYGWQIKNGRDDGGDDVGADLAVIKIGARREDICAIAWVAVDANPDSTELARTYARDRAKAHTCPKLEDENLDAGEGAIIIGKPRAHD